MEKKTLSQITSEIAGERAELPTWSRMIIFAGVCDAFCDMNTGAGSAANMRRALAEAALAVECLSNDPCCSPDAHALRRALAGGDDAEICAAMDKFMAKK